MVLLVDANIVLDFLLKREPFYSDSKKVMEICRATAFTFRKKNGIIEE